MEQDQQVYKITIKNSIAHLRIVLKHKKEVFKAMCLVGHPIQGLLHDMSKFHPIEFWESVRYFNQGKGSPIEVSKRVKGHSRAWFHHRGVNPHHSQYWVDISFGEVIPCEMPWKYIVESVCDTIAAGKTYLGDKWTNSSPINYFNSRDCKSFFAPFTRFALKTIYEDISVMGWEAVARKLDYNSHLKNSYKGLLEWEYNRGKESGLESKINAPNEGPKSIRELTDIMDRKYGYVARINRTNLNDK